VGGLAPVKVEAFSWVNRFIGGDGTGCVAVLEPAQAGDTVLSVLRRLGERYPELRGALWARGSDELAEYLVVMVNHKAAGAHGTLDAELRPGDTLSLLGQYSGG
jgi:molybdopterin converting factor small subunit